MTDLTPTPDLIREWFNIWIDEADYSISPAENLATHAARWGYKQRLIEEDQSLMQIVPPPENDIHHD